MTFSIQKANFWKRFSAWMIDAFLVLLLSVALSIPMLEILQLNRYSEQLAAIQTTYRAQVEAQYPNVDLDISEVDYNALPQPEKDEYDAASKALDDLLSADIEFVELRADRITVIIINACITLFISVLFAHFILPLLLKNGQTLGKKTFHLGVMRTNGVKITPLQLFLRSIVGMFAIETVAFAFLLIIFPIGTIAAGLVLILQAGVMIKTPTNSAIHDLLSDTVVIEFSSQHIFNSEDERKEFFAREEAEAENDDKDE